MNLSVENRKKLKLVIILIAVTFAFKLALASYFSRLGDCKNPELTAGYLAKTAGDTFSYLGSIDNFIEQGEFYFWNGERKVYAGRMPYYGAPYFLLRLFAEKSPAYDLLVLFQIFFDALATVYFARLCRDVFDRRIAFFFGYALYFLSFNYFANALYLYTESFSLSFMILFFYAFQRWWSGKNKSAVWTANLFLALSIVLKPYLAPVFLVFLAIYCYRENLFGVERIKLLIGRTALLGLPLFLLLAPWLLRNLVVLREPIIAQESLLAGYKHTEADAAVRRFSGGWGGDLTFWDAASAACYFKLDPPFPCTFTLPEYSLTGGYTARDIEEARADYLEFQRNPSPELEAVVVGKFDRLTGIYRREKPFMFYVGSGFVRVKTMFWHSNNYNLPIFFGSQCFRSYQLIFKIVQTLIYALALTFGLAGLLYLAAKKRVSLLFVFVPLFLPVFFGFYVWNVEARYFNHAYPLLLLGLVAVFVRVYSLAENRFSFGKRIS